MKKMNYFVNAALVFSLVFFSACQKEAVAPSPTTPSLSTTQTAATERSDYYPTVTFGVYPNCVETVFGLCVYDFLPYAPDVLMDNQATGQVYVNEEEDLVLDLDRLNLSEATIEDVMTNQTFTVAAPMEIPHEMVVALYENAGYEAPADAFLIHPGEYFVELDGDPAQTATATPKKIIVKFRRDGTIRKIIYKF